MSGCRGIWAAMKSLAKERQGNERQGLQVGKRLASPEVGVDGAEGWQAQGRGCDFKTSTHFDFA